VGITNVHNALPEVLKSLDIMELGIEDNRLGRENRQNTNFTNIKENHKRALVDLSNKQQEIADQSTKALVRELQEMSRKTRLQKSRCLVKFV
jgi:hypothetical protein